MDTTIHRDSNSRQGPPHGGDRFRRFDAALERLERIADQLETSVGDVRQVEDRLDRQRRPYGDGRRV